MKKTRTGPDTKKAKIKAHLKSELAKEGKKKRKQTTSEKAAAEGFVIRSITLPVAYPIRDGAPRDFADEEDKQAERSKAWREARALINVSLRETLDLHNWLVRQIARLDTAWNWNATGDENGWKLPPMPDLKSGSPLVLGLVGHNTLYLAGRKIAPHLDTHTVSMIAREVERSYKSDRLDVFLGKRSFRCYKSPVIPLPEQTSARNPLIETEDGRLEIGFPFKDPETKKVVWTRWALAGGRRYGRSIAGAKAIARGEVKHRAVYMIEKRRLNRKPQLMVKIVGLFPKRFGDRELKGDMLVSTHHDALLRYRMDNDDKDFFVRYHHLKGLCYQRQKRRKHLSDDMKLERRGAKERQRMTAGLHVKLEKLKFAIEDALKCAAKELVNVTVRRHAKRLVYRDKARTKDEAGKETLVQEDRFLKEFPWFQLRDRIAVLCNESGIEFVYDEHAKLVLAAEAEKDDRSNTTKEKIRDHCQEEVGAHS